MNVVHVNLVIPMQTDQENGWISNEQGLVSGMTTEGTQLLIQYLLDNIPLVRP